MRSEHRERGSIAQDGRALPGWLLELFGGMTIVGTAAFVFGILGPGPLRAWQAYLINFVFWTGLAAGAMLFSAILSITHAHWGRPLKRLAEAPGAFLALAPLLFAVLFGGREKIFPWIAHPVPEKEAWLNVPFLFLRNGVGLTALAAVALGLIYLSVRRETGAAPPGESAPAAEDGGREERGAVILANVYGILYAVVLSVLAFDLIMSLSPHWHSTLFGAYYFVGSFFAGLAALTVLAALAVRAMGLGRYVRPPQLHNLGKLLLGFTLMAGDFFFTQFFVIWYGNLPEETHYVILRTRFEPWSPLAWTVLAACFFLPFVVLLNRAVKMRPLPMLLLSVVILGGLWLEKFLLVVPSIWDGEGLPAGLTELGITVGFAGMMGLCVLLFLRRFPALPYGDPLFALEAAKAAEESHG